eukprot:4040444-Alexandrium_andersonii.AAC.1
MERLGGGATDLKEARLLNRIIRWTPGGYLYEADPRHAEQLLRDALGAAGGARAVTFPGYKRGPADGKSVAALQQREAGQYRALAARANYLSMDRPDLSFAAKECCRR